MCQHVLPETSLSELFLTDITFLWLLTRVSPETTSLRELFFTDLILFVWLLIYMQKYVLSEMHSHSELFPIDVIFVWLGVQQ